MIDFAEIISGENIASNCDYVFSQTISVNGQPQPYISEVFPRLRGGEIIFCKTDFIDYLRQCFDRFVDPSIKTTIVTHDSDYSLTDDIISRFGNRLISWWGMNCESTMANPLPIGIANSYCQKTLKSFEHGAANRLLYVNHREDTYPVLRKKVYNLFQDKEWATIQKPVNCSIEQYRQELLDHKFVVCPRGNGIDTHRMWEALYCGVIPIVVRHNTYRLLEKNSVDGGLPILFVDSYEEVTEKILNEEYTKIRSSEWNMDMLNVSWWMNKIRKGMK